MRLTAQPDPGFKFVTWIGNLSGTENPKSLLMDSEWLATVSGYRGYTYKWVRAIFLDSQSFESNRIISGEPVEWLFGLGAERAQGYNGYWVNVPQGATQLGIHLTTATQGTDVDLYANRGYYPGRPRRILGENNEEIVGYQSQYLSTGPGGNKAITITPKSSPPLEPGLYFIAINVRTAGVRVKGTLTAEVNVSESAISAHVPHFGFPASLITKTVKDENPPPQALEIRNSGGGTLDYQIHHGPILALRLTRSRFFHGGNRHHLNYRGPGKSGAGGVRGSNHDHRAASMAGQGPSHAYCYPGPGRVSPSGLCSFRQWGWY